MEIVWQELTAGLPDWQHLERVIIRLIVAAFIGAMIGYQRQRAGKSAGFRTHILVALGTCLFILACVGNGMSQDSITRVIQGIVTGIGFLGAGAILKVSSEHHIHGLTSAAGIWMTAAIGVTVGLGMIGLAILAAIMTLIVLSVLRRFEPVVTDPPEEEHKAKNS